MDFKKDIYQDPDIRKYVKIISRDSRAFASLGNALLGKGYVEDAIEVCREGLENDPDFTAGRAVLGKCYVKDGKTELALAEFESILEKSHDNVVALKGLGEIYYSLERYQDAREMYDRLLFIDPMNSDFQEMSEKIEILMSSVGSENAPQKAVVQETADSVEEAIPRTIAMSEESPDKSRAEVPSFARESESLREETVEYIEEKAVFEMVNQMKILTSLSERAMASGFNARTQEIFSMMHAVFRSSSVEDIVSQLDTYLNSDGDEGEIIPIERGVSPHEGDSLEIAGTENIGLQEPPVSSLEDKVESADSIVSNEELAYESSGSEELSLGDEKTHNDEMAYMEELIDKSIKEEPDEEKTEPEMNNEVSYSSQEELSDSKDVGLDTTLKGKNNFDMEMQETKEDIPVNDIAKGLEESIPEDEITNDMPEDEEIDEEIDEDIEDVIEDVIEDEDISGSVPFRDDSYESLEDEINEPQDLNALMAEAEKSISGDDEAPESDILNELEEETASYQMERENESFSGEKILNISNETAPPDIQNMDKFKGHSEVEVGEISTEAMEESRFSGKEEIDMGQEHIKGVKDERFARNEPIDVAGGVIPEEVSAEAEPEQDAFTGSGDLAMNDVDLDGNEKEFSSDDKSLLDADDEKIDDISKWLNEL